MNVPNISMIPLANKPLQTLVFLHERAAFDSLQVALQMWQFGLLTYPFSQKWPSSQNKIWLENVGSSGTFQEPIERGDVAWEGRAASVLGQAVF